MKKTVPVLLIFCLVGHFAHAQDKPGYYGGTAGVSLGSAYLNAESFQAFLTSEFGTLENNFKMRGLNAFKMYGNRIVGAGAYALNGPQTTGDSLVAKVRGAMGFLYLGTTLINAPRIKLYPLLGIGAANFKLNVTPDKLLNLVNIWDDYRREITITSGTFMLDFGMGLDLMLNSKRGEGMAPGGLRLGLRAGYLFAVPTHSWNYTGGSIEGGPKLNTNGFKLEITVGGGSFRKQPVTPSE